MRESTPVVKELVAIGLAPVSKWYKSPATSGEGEDKVTAFDVCEQVTIPGYPALQNAVNITLKKAAYLRALNKARSERKGDEPGKAPRSSGLVEIDENE